MKLQLALDKVNIKNALRIIEETVESIDIIIDIIDIGTPMVIHYGKEAVRTVRKQFPSLQVPADLKIMDAGKGEAILVDTTCSTPCLVNESGTPLSLLPEFSDDPDAMFIFWKDHTSIKQTDQINEFARSRDGVDYTRHLAGVYSSEWFLG